MGTLIGIVRCRVVAANKRPSWLRACILRRRMKQIGVEEEPCTGSHFAMDMFQAFSSRIHPFRVGPRLPTKTAMLNSPHKVRSFKDFEAAIGASRRVNGNQTTGHVR